MRIIEHLIIVLLKNLRNLTLLSYPLPQVIFQVPHAVRVDSNLLHSVKKLGVLAAALQPSSPGLMSRVFPFDLG